MKAELKRHITALENDDVDVMVLKKLAWLCVENPVHEEPSEFKSGFALPMSPSPASMIFDNVPSLVSTLWEEEKLFDRMFNALLKCLTSNKVSLMLNQNDSAILNTPFRLKTSSNTGLSYCGKS